MTEFEILHAAAFLHQGVIGRCERSGSVWSPNVDVYLTEDKAVIKVELAGVRKEDLELLVHGPKVVVRGIRRDDDRPKESRFLIMEINYGPFEAVVELPSEYETAEARAVFNNGFLTIIVPTKPQAINQPRVVQVEVIEK